MKEYKITLFALFLMLIFVIGTILIGCESPTSPHKTRTKQTIEIRNNGGFRG